MFRFCLATLGLMIVLALASTVSANDTPFPTLQQVQANIAASGATWTARENHITILTPQERKRYTTSIDVPFQLNMAQGQTQTRIVVPKSMPLVYDWRNVNGVNWNTGVRDQASCGGCWAFAAVAALETIINIVMVNPNLDMDLSEQTVIACATGDCDSGGIPDNAIEFMAEDGTPDEACYPYEEINGSCGDRCSDWRNRSIKVRHKAVDGWGNIINLDLQATDEIKAHIQRGPVTACLVIYDDFYYYGGGVYEHDYCNVLDAMNNGHVVSIVGWDDTKQAWIIKNSWDTDWGINGYGYLKYGAACIAYWVNWLTVDTSTIPGYIPPDGDSDPEPELDPEPEYEPDPQPDPDPRPDNFEGVCWDGEQSCQDSSYVSQCLNGRWRVAVFCFNNETCQMVGEYDADCVATTQPDGDVVEPEIDIITDIDDDPETIDTPQDRDQDISPEADSPPTEADTDTITDTTTDAPTVCQPESLDCVGDTIVQCNKDGDGWLIFADCSPRTCEDGHCAEPMVDGDSDDQQEVDTFKPPASTSSNGCSAGSSLELSLILLACMTLLAGFRRLRKTKPLLIPSLSGIRIPVQKSPL